MFRKLLAVLAVLLVLAAIAIVLFVRGRIGGDVVRQALEAQLTARVGQPVHIGSLTASYFPRVALDLHAITIGDPVRATIGEISIVTGLRGLLSRRVEDAALIVSNSRIPVGVALGIAGAASGGGDGTSSGAAVTIVSVRTLAFRGVEIVAEPHSLQVDLESSLTGDRLDVSRLVAESAGTRLEAHGTLTSIARRTGTFTATAGRLNLDEILAIGAGLSAAVPSAGAPAGASKSAPLDLHVALTAPGGTLSGYAFTSLSATARLTADEVLLDPMSFGIFGGTYAGRLRVDSGTTPLAAGLEGNVSGIDMATLLKQTNGSTSMTGTLSGTIALDARGVSTADVLRTAAGHGRVTIADGAIPGLDMVRAVVLAFGKPTGAPPEGSGSTFTRLGGNFTLANRTLTSTDLAFASRDFDMTGRASVGLPEGTLDMHVNVRLSRELTAQAGTDLRRYAQEDGRVVVPATLSGTVRAPRVTLDVAAALNRALQNEINRRVGSWLDRVIKK